MIVQGLGPVLAMFEQLQGLSRILVHNGLLHRTPEIESMDHQLFKRIKVLTRT